MKRPIFRYSLSCLFGLFVLCNSCKKLEQLFAFTISNQSSVTIPSSSPVNLPVDIATPNVTSNSSQEFKNNNTNVNLVKNITLQSLQLSITSPSNQTFNFLQSIHIYISTNSSNEIELAYLDQIPANVNLIGLIPTQASLDQYVKASSYNLRTTVVTSQILTQNVNINVDSKFRVTASL
ncbi:MAG TPA: hypothetical protein VGZ90_07365 [Puia sp.]|jgi:hypothetical protein|nr:hypothetical protein [Puia sp.]